MEYRQHPPARLGLVPPDVPEVRVAARNSSAALSTAILRIFLGLAWTANAAMKWVPAFGAAFLSMLTGVSQDQPEFLKPGLSLATAIASDGRASFLALGSAALGTYRAVALHTGFAGKLTYGVGALHSDDLGNRRAVRRSRQPGSPNQRLSVCQR